MRGGVVVDVDVEVEDVVRRPLRRCCYSRQQSPRLSFDSSRERGMENCCYYCRLMEGWEYFELGRDFGDVVVAYYCCCCGSRHSSVEDDDDGD